MNRPEFLDPRLTEQRNPNTTRIDVASSLEIVDMMYEEDRRVPDAVHAAREEIAKAIDLTVEAFRGHGRLIYVGAGTSGRLGVLDASECPPTFGSPPQLVMGVIAGGPPALTRSQEGAEDDPVSAVMAMDELGILREDFVLGVAASGTTPFVGGALRRAQEIGASTGLICCSTPSALLAQTCDVVIQLDVGPEVIAGSTRLKAGTATKLTLNAISTGAMIRTGKAYGNMMVDLQAMSAKLVDRGERIVMEATGASRSDARRAITAARGSVKLAIVMQRRGVSRDEAVEILEKAGGILRQAVGDPPEIASG